MSTSLFKKKINAINKIKDKIYFFEKKNSYLKEAQNLYYPTYTDSIGLSDIYKLSDAKIDNFSYFMKIIKNIFSGIFFSYSKIIGSQNKINFDNIIFTWANLGNFKHDGSLDDKFFNINSKQTKNTLWIVIYFDQNIPRKIGDNIIIYKNFNKIFNFFSFTFTYILTICS